MIINCGRFRRKGIQEYSKRMMTPRTRAMIDFRVRKILLKKFRLVGSYDPQSIYEPKQLFDVLERFGEEVPFHQDADMDYAIFKATKVFGYREHLQKLQPSFDEGLMRLHPDKSGGIYMCSKEESLPLALSDVSRILLGKKSPNPCIAFARTQANNKTRLVWGYPTDMAILESRFGFQLIDLFKQIRTPITYSLRRLELGARLQSTMRGRNIVCLDFSKFDSTVPKQLIRVAFRILRTWFEFRGDDEKAWRTVVDYFVNTPIVMPDGCLYKGKVRGIPSGSLFTQLVGSIVNFILINYAARKCGVFIPKNCLHVLGDDSVFSTNSDVSLDKFAKHFKNLGMVLNVSKSDVTSLSTGFKFLGVVWKDGVPHFDEKRIWRSGVFPERWRKYPSDELRAEVVAFKAIVLPLLSIGIEGSLLLTGRRNPIGPAAMFTETVSTEGAEHMPGYLRYVMTYDDARRSGLWNVCAFPYSS